MSQQKFIYPIFLSCIVVVLVLLPVFHAVFIAKVPRSEMRLALGHFYYDAGGSGFYPARIREIADGYPFFGNPYLFEHREGLSRASFGADWLAALPLFFGLSLNATLIFNAFFWSIIFALLAYFLCRKLGLSFFYSALAALLSFSQGYFLIVRIPVSMQEVFPFLLVFYLAYLYWLSDPYSWKKSAVLAAAIALPFYIYTFLWQVVGFTAISALIFWWIRGERHLAKRLIAIGVIAFLLALPMLWYMFQQTTSPFYEDMVQRFGIVNSRIPTTLAFSSGAWVVIAILLWLSSYHWMKNSQAFSFFLITGFGLLAANFSNILTGKDMELPIHVERFIAIWAPLSLVSYLYFALKHKIFFERSALWHKSITAVLLAASISGVFYYLGYWHHFSFGKVDKGLMEIQGPASWLDLNEKEPAVILTGPLDEAATKIPVFTRHYVLFAPVAIYAVVSSKEVEDRYLIASYFRPSTLNIEKLKEDFLIYAGLGAEHQYQAPNRRVKWCRLLQLPRLGVFCGELADLVSFRGGAYFENLYQRYANEIEPNIAEKIKEYHVKYFLFDLTGGSREFFEDKVRSLGVSAPPVYEDERYLIYKL